MAQELARFYHPGSADPVASFESENFPGQYIRHRNSLGELTPVVSNLDRMDASFIVRPALSGTPDGSTR